MRPPPVRSDRSAQSSAADQITPQRTTPRCDGADRGLTQHASESSHRKLTSLLVTLLFRPRARLEPVPDILLPRPGHSRVGEHARACANARTTNVELEKKVALVLKRAEIAEEKSSRFESELVATVDSSREVKLKYEALLRLRDHDLQLSSHATRKDVKGIGASVMTQVKENLFLLKRRSLVEREIVEIKANQDFLAGIQRGDYPDPEAEAASMAEDLSVVKGKLAAVSLPSLDLDDLARRFDDSLPPSDEVDSETALVVVVKKAAEGSTPLAVVPLASASFDQFGSMTTSLNVEDAQNLRESDPPEESGPRDEESVGGSQEVAPLEGETEQPGAGLNDEAGVEGHT
ncbi:unnamed protein product [Cochlearia groenlandica]